MRPRRSPARSPFRRLRAAPTRAPLAAGALAVAAQPAPAARTSGPTGAATGRSGSSSSCSCVTLFAEFIANDRPIVVSYKGELLFPVFVDYPETKFGGFLAVTDYRDPFIADEIDAERLDALAADPLLLRHRDDRDLPAPAPVAADLAARREAQCCARYPRRASSDPDCSASATGNWLGTDDQGRDVVARLIYGFRISVLFGADADRHLLGHRHRSPARCRAISAAGST